MLLMINISNMTTVADLIAFLQRFPSNALVFTNQYGGDWSEEHPIDLGASKFHPQSHMFRDISGNLQYSETEIEDSIGQQDVVRLVA